MNPFTLYLPTNESQAYPSFDSYACTNYSICNLFETYLNRIIGEKTISVDNAKWLNDNGFLDQYGKLDFSDQYNGILSGTEYGKGNYFEKVIESVLRDGLIPDIMFTDNPTNPAQYYDITLITQRMLNIGQEFLKRFKIEILSKFATLEVLKTDLLWLTINVCPGYGVDPVIKNCVYPPSHAVLGYDVVEVNPNNLENHDYVNFFDTYPEYRKKISPLNCFAKWQLKIKEKTMYRLIKLPNDEDVYFINEKNERVQIGDLNTYNAFLGKLWEGIDIVDEATFKSHKKGGIIIITKSE